LIKFKIHAVKTNEILLLTASVVAEMLLRHENTLGTEGEAVSAFLAAPYDTFVHNPWWDVAVAPPGTSAQVLSDSLHSICAESSSLLREALSVSPHGVREGNIMGGATQRLWGTGTAVLHSEQ
jgi:hypothetical protein